MTDNSHDSNEPGWGSEPDEDDDPSPVSPSADVSPSGLSPSSMPPPPSGDPILPPPAGPPATPFPNTPPAGPPATPFPNTPTATDTAAYMPPPSDNAGFTPPTYTPADQVPPGAPPPPGFGSPPSVPPPPPSTVPPPPGTPGGQPPTVAPTSGGGGMSLLVKVLLGVGALVVVLLVASAVLAAMLAESATVGAGSIERGECFADFAQFETDATGTGEVTSVDRIDCAEAHALEAFYVGPAYESYDLYPGVEEIDDVAITSCRQRFELFVDFEWESSELDFWWLTPTQSGWDQGDRELVCLVGDFDKELVVGTLENAGR